MLKLANILFHPLIKIDLCQSPWVCFERFHTIGKCWSKGRLIIKKERETATNWLKVKVWKSLSHVRLFATPWTGVGSLSLLQGIFLTQGSNPGLPHCRWILYQLSHRGSPHPDWELKYEGIDTMNYIPKTKNNLHLGFQQILLNKTGYVMYLILCVLYTHCMTLSKLKEWNIFSFS